MTFTRIPIFGSTGILLLQLVACSASDPVGTGKSGAQNERVDSDAVGSETDPNRADRSQQLDNPCAGGLDPKKIKWLNTLQKPPVFKPISEEKDPQGLVTHQEYQVTVKEADVQMLPDGCPTTQVFAYGGRTLENDAETWSSPGATFEMTRGVSARVKWLNEIGIPHLFSVDPTLHWANPNGVPAPDGPFEANYPTIADAQSPVPVVTHVHGLEVGSASDGTPEAWFTATGKKGPQFLSEFSNYPNSQPATTLWYHDHVLGITRLNVYAGLAGMYVIRDPKSEIEKLPGLPDRAHEMPLVIQDKIFKADGSLVYPDQNSPQHPYWSMSFGGDTFVVNGKVWPSMNVDRTRYRFRMLNGANNRTFTLALQAPPAQGVEAAAPALPKLTVIGSDGGYLSAPAEVGFVKLAPGERADVLIDFSDLDVGQSVILSNEGEDVVRFTANPLVVTPPPLPKALDTAMVELKPDVAKRTVTLNAATDGGFLLNGQMYDSKVSELPVLGSTEDWDIVNLSGEPHPIHLHLVQFRIKQRRQLKVDGYLQAWNTENDGGALPLMHATVNPDADAYLVDESEMDDYAKETAKILAPESGWKDTIVAPGGFVTRIRVRWAPQEAPASTKAHDDLFAKFDATKDFGYLWHCHMLEHEDNEMMRPLQLVK